MSYAAAVRRLVVPYEAAETRALRAFRQEYFGAGARQCDEAFNTWLFERNPHRRGNTPVMWVCQRDGIVVGQQGCIPVLLKAGEIEYRAAWGIDLMVREDWRLRGVGPALSAAFEGCAEILLGLGVSTAAFRAYSRAGWADMGRLSFWVRPIDVGVCAQALQQREWLAGLTPDVLLRGTARVMGTAARVLRHCALERVHAFDERADGVWATAARDYDVLVKRDFESLRWRFDQTPDPGRYERYYLTRRAQVIGYAVIRFDSWRGHPVARVSDYLTERRYVWPLFALLIDRMREKGAVAVFIEQLDAASSSTLRSLGCVRAAAVTQFILKVKPGAAHLSQGVKHAAGWLVTRADADCDMPAFPETTSCDQQPLAQTPARVVSGLPAPESSSG